MVFKKPNIDEEEEMHQDEEELVLKQDEEWMHSADMGRYTQKTYFVPNRYTSIFVIWFKELPTILNEGKSCFTPTIILLRAREAGSRLKAAARQEDTPKPSSYL